MADAVAAFAAAFRRSIPIPRADARGYMLPPLSRLFPEFAEADCEQK